MRVCSVWAMTAPFLSSPSTVSQRLFHTTAPKNTGAPLLSDPRASKGFLPRRAEHQHVLLLPSHTYYWWQALGECSRQAEAPFVCPASTYGTEVVPRVQHAKIMAHWSLWSWLGRWWFHAQKGKPKGRQAPAPTHQALGYRTRVPLTEYCYCPHP